MEWPHWLQRRRHARRDALRDKQRRTWESEWSRDDFQPPWAGRGISQEILDAVESGWFPRQGAVLDIGCGLGEIAAWFAARDHETLGFDVAESAIQKARALHAPLPPILEFQTLDLCEQAPPNRNYRILIDRGCLHQISALLTSSFVRNLVSVCAPDARMLLFMKAFREGRPFADRRETRRHVARMRDLFADTFTVERHAPTYLDRDHGQNPATALPGLVFWLARSPRG